LRLLIGCDAVVADWVAERIDGCERGWSDARAIGVTSRAGLIAGVVYHDWSPESEVIELSAAATSRHWMTRAVMSGILGYPFGFCQMVVARYRPDTPAQRIWRALGSDEFLIPRLMGRGRDCVLATLTAEQWAESPLNNGGCDHGQT